MNNDRYAKSCQYKSELDNSFHISSNGMYNSRYSDILLSAKNDGYKVLRNSKGEHKVIDITNGKVSPLEFLQSMFGMSGGDYEK